jgi:hypothetical protein
LDDQHNGSLVAHEVSGGFANDLESCRDVMDIPSPPSGVRTSTTSASKKRPVIAQDECSRKGGSKYASIDKRTAGSGARFSTFLYETDAYAHPSAISVSSMFFHTNLPFQEYVRN